MLVCLTSSFKFNPLCQRQFFTVVDGAEKNASETSSIKQKLAILSMYFLKKYVEFIIPSLPKI